MKKIIVISAIIALTSSANSALPIIDPVLPAARCWQVCANNIEPDPSTCSDLLCDSCKGRTSSGTNGIDTTEHNLPDIDCNTGVCSCRTFSTYACSAGYYGTATSASAGCTACPDNATCNGGNNSTFVCDKGYYKLGGNCYECPLSDDGSVRGTTASTGATSITDCYLPDGTLFSDDTGSGTYTSKCNYVN